MKSNLTKISALALMVLSLAFSSVISASAASITPTIYYRSHCQNIGWTSPVSNGYTGTVGQSLQLEAVQASISGMSGGIKYRMHSQNIGWGPWVQNGMTAGTEGMSLRGEAVEFYLTGTIAQYYDVVYRSHCQNVGWTPWVKNGATSGTTGQSLRLEAIEIKLVAKSGASPLSTNNSTAWDSPMRGNVVTTQAFGRSGHLGVDMKSTSDQNVYAAADGKVVAVGLNGTGANASTISNPKGNGYYVVIEHSLNGKKVYSMYGHLAAGTTKVSVNQTVSKGTVIGVCGNTGRSTGTHLHFAIANTLKPGSYYGYTAAGSTFSSQVQNESRSGVTFYNPTYVINNDRLP